MPIPSDFLSSLISPHPKVILDRINPETKISNSATVWTWRDEVSPVDLYCYLVARFGEPNGLLSLLRTNDSDNLIHWHWMLDHPLGELQFIGMSYRTEVWISLDADIQSNDSEFMISLIKADFAKWGKQKAEIKKRLELWTEFVNPYRRLASAVEKMLQELRLLNLDPQQQEPSNGTTFDPFPDHEWNEVLSNYSKGLGLCFGIRSMLPVLAEAFVNLILFTLLRPEIKSDSRLRDNVVRQPIDIRIKSLHLNCIGFVNAVDFTTPECKLFHSLMNERNDTLHGNVVIEKLRFNDVFFDGTIPVFKEYQSMWQRLVGVDIRAVGLHRLEEEVKIVDDFCKYLTTCMSPEVKKQFEHLSSKRDLGWNQQTGRMGVLFPDHLVDMRVSMS